MKRSTYDSSIKHLYRLGLADGIPKMLQQQISRSNKCRWRKENESKYIGHELNNLANQEMEILLAFAQPKRRKQLFVASIRVIKTLQTICDSQLIEKVLFQHKEQVVNLAERVKEAFSIDQYIRIIGISKSTFHNWKQEIISKCDSSYLTRCFQRFPLQASATEVHQIKSILTDPAFAFWPIRSISAYCRREKILFLSDTSWYKYSKLLGIKRPKPKSRRKKKTKGLQAEKPNQIWHADVSVFRIANVKYYIYLVTDNFSRRLLSWHVSNKLSAQLRLQTIEEAYRKAQKRFADLQIDLIVDGGSENNNTLVNVFVEKNRKNLQKLIALKDIVFSNSMIEAQFSLMKYNYLYRMKIETQNDLIKAMQFIDNDFNHIRPHSALNGATPDEAYFNSTILPKNQYLIETKEAKTIRIKENKSMKCAKCAF